MNISCMLYESRSRDAVLGHGRGRCGLNYGRNTWTLLQKKEKIWKWWFLVTTACRQLVIKTLFSSLQWRLSHMIHVLEIIYSLIKLIVLLQGHLCFFFFFFVVFFTKSKHRLYGSCELASNGRSVQLLTELSRDSGSFCYFPPVCFLFPLVSVRSWSTFIKPSDKSKD